MSFANFQLSDLDRLITYWTTKEPLALEVCLAKAYLTEKLSGYDVLISHPYGVCVEASLKPKIVECEKLLRRLDEL